MAMLDIVDLMQQIDIGKFYNKLNQWSFDQVYYCSATVSDLTAGMEVERKRHISAPDESHSDSESTSLLSRHEPSPAIQLLPRPRSSAALDDMIDSSTHTAAVSDANANIEDLVANVTGSATSVCTVLCFLLLLLLYWRYSFKFCLKC